MGIFRKTKQADAAKLISQAQRDLAKERYGLAAARLDRALQLDEEVAEASLAEFYRRATDENFDGREKAVDALLDYRLAGLHAVLFALNSGLSESALDWSKEFLMRFPGDLGGLTLRSLTLEFVGRYSDALEVCDQLVELYPQDSVSVERRAAVHISFANEQRDTDEDLARRHFEAALLDYDLLITLDPEAASPLILRGHLRVDLGRTDGALSDYTHAIDLEPSSVEAHFARGVLYEAYGAYEQALVDFDSVVAGDPQLAQGYLRRGSVLSALGESDRARADFTEALRLEPDNPDALLGRGIATFAAATDPAGGRDYTENETLLVQALADLDATLATFPEDLAAGWNRALVLRNLDAYDWAVDGLSRTLDAIDPEDVASRADILAERAEALRLWGQTLGVPERLEEAVRDFDEAGALGAPPWVLAAKGAALTALGRLPEAGSAFDEALALDPDSVWGLVSRAKLQHTLGRDVEALAAFERAAALSVGTPEAAWVQVGRGLMLEATGGAAGDAFELALDDAEDAGAYVERGGLFEDYSTASALDHAENDYREALAIAPSSAEARNSLAWLYVDKLPTPERLAEAASLAEEALSLPGAESIRGFCLDTLGWIEFKLERYEQAVERLREAHELAQYRLVRRVHLETAQAATARERAVAAAPAGS
jgi:tetratricopeptide (TPR) repeat protein